MTFNCSLWSDSRLPLSGLLALFVAMIMAACALPQNRIAVGTGGITTDMLVEASPVVKGRQLKDFSGLDIVEITPEMAANLDAYIDRDMAENTKYRRLLRLVMEDGQFELVYDDVTRTAAETYRDHRGNCLSFTNLFVAMARHVGLKASYQEVEIPPDWSTAGHALLLSQHVNVFVNMSLYSDRVVDFNTEVVNFRVLDLKPSYERRIISDQRARAHFFNNIGVEYMLLAGDTLSALASLQQSILEDRTFAPAWISLGILYRREGFPEYEEASYLQALKLDPTSLVAMSNLATLYEDQGLDALAGQYRQAVRSHRMNNPYYRYYLADEAFASGDYQTAIAHLQAAIRKRQDEDRFYYLLSLSYLMEGDSGAAQHWMRKAGEVAAEDSDRQRYQHKLDMLKQMEPERGA